MSTHGAVRAGLWLSVVLIPKFLESKKRTGEKSEKSSLNNQRNTEIVLKSLGFFSSQARTPREVVKGVCKIMNLRTENAGEAEARGTFGK